MKQALNRILTGMVAGALLALPAHAEDIYKWVNADGETQYTQMPPPPGIKAIRLKSAPPPASGSVAATPAGVPSIGKAAGNEAGEEQAEDPEEAARIAQSRKENCTKARRNLGVLNRSGNIRYRTSDGEVIRLTEEQRQQRIEETKQQIEQLCEG